MNHLLTSLVVLFAISPSAFGQNLTPDQQLIVACHQLEVSKVVLLLRNDANVEAKFGKSDTKSYFQDPWDGGWPMSASQWTPLQALANSSQYPAPSKKYRQRTSVPKSVVELRSKKRIQILNILLSHGCDINAGDDRGATSLYDSICGRHEGMALTLLDFSPDVNTKTGIYIDGTFNTTPLHCAYWSAAITKRLLTLGADDDARDSVGDTPKDWRRRTATQKTR